MADPDDGKAISQTPTWVVASVTAVFVLISVLVERSIFLLSSWFLRTKKRKPLYHSLQKMKEELMILGFISLFMSSLSSFLFGICIESSFYDTQLTTCKYAVNNLNEAIGMAGKLVLGHSTGGEHFCPKGKERFISLQDIHEIHHLLFITAATHILYSCMTVGLALMKVHKWHSWELDAHGDAYDSFVEIAKDTPLKRQFIFALYHTSKPWTINSFLVWGACFGRQLGQSVTRADYLTIRSGFVAEHNLGQKYNFHSYLTRCMEEDFTSIVGVSIPLWGFAILCILLNFNGSNFYFWIALAPIVVLLAIGTKLQHVVATLTVEKLGSQKNWVAARRKANSELFWFGCPEFLLWLLHFTLFQNAFELATFLWSLWRVPDHSCLMGNHTFVYIRLILGLSVQVLCSYSTLPSYALVTQIGSSFKKMMISEKIRESLRNWHMDARERARHRVAVCQGGCDATMEECQAGQDEEEHTRRLHSEGNSSSSSSSSSKTQLQQLCQQSQHTHMGQKKTRASH